MMNNELRRQDLAWCVNTLPKKLRALMKESAGRMVLGGGYVRDRVAGVKPSDIDLFAPTKDAAELWAHKLSDDGESPYKTKNALTIKGSGLTIQIIHRWTYEKATDVVKSFDFTIAMAAIWYAEGEWRSEIHPDFYPDLAAKRLVYTSPERNEDAGGSILRVLKFYQRGYRIPLDSMGAVVARLMGGIRNPELMDEAERSRVITGLLREVDPAIDPEHFSHLPSSVNAADINDDEPKEQS